MKAEDPMAMMREAHRELSASYQQVAANKKPSARLCRWFCMKFVRLEVNQMNYSNIHYVNLRAEMARGNIGIGQMAKALHISRDTMARKLAGRSPLRRSGCAISSFHRAVSKHCSGKKGKSEAHKTPRSAGRLFRFFAGALCKSARSGGLAGLAGSTVTKHLRRRGRGSGACLLGIAQCAASFLWRSDIAYLVYKKKKKHL